MYIKGEWKKKSCVQQTHPKKRTASQKERKKKAEGGIYIQEASSGEGIHTVCRIFEPCWYASWITRAARFSLLCAHTVLFNVCYVRRERLWYGIIQLEILRKFYTFNNTHTKIEITFFFFLCLRKKIEKFKRWNIFFFEKEKNFAFILPHNRFLSNRSRSIVKTLR